MRTLEAQHVHSDPPTLFSHFGIALPLTTAHQLQGNKLRPHGCQTLQLVHDRTEVERGVQAAPNPQFVLEFMEGDNSNVVKFIPNSRYIFLSYGVHDTFRHIPELRSVTLKLQRFGCADIGQLVQMKESEILALPFVTQRHLETMKAQLDQAALEFGMIIPSWNKAGSQH